MIKEIEISICDFVCALSEVVDLISPALNSHHHRVAYIAGKIASELNLPNDEVQEIILASMMHDIGAFSVSERMKVYDVNATEDDLNQHALYGFKLLKNFEPLAEAATLIKYHHADYNSQETGIPFGSYIISMADKVSVMFDENREILDQVPTVYEKFSRECRKFHPEAFAAFFRLTKLEYFMIEAFSPSFNTRMLTELQYPKKIIDLNTLRAFAEVIAHIIDFRSRFTATHSIGVAAVAKELSAIYGFSERECKLMEIAGLLHDLGKVTVPDTILEKKGKLDENEINVIRKHTYYTYMILCKVRGLEHIAEWAAFHHERQDGNGYPFHIKREDSSKLSRIMAVADVTTALTEDRPYRAGMSKEQTIEVLSTMANTGGIDTGIVGIAVKNFSRINDARRAAQSEVQKKYDAFWSA